MDRCELAYRYHRQGYNCAQSTAAAFADVTGWTPEQMFAAAGAFGGGFGATHEEACGAISGALVVLSILFPHAEGENKETKRRLYGLVKTFRQRFLDVFGHTRCTDLLRARPGVSEKTPAARRLDIAKHCDVMVVTAVEMLEELLREEGRL